MSFAKAYRLIPSARKRQLPMMLLSALLSALIDLVGIAALVSVLLLVLDENILANNPVFAAAYEFFGFGSMGSFIVAVCLAVVVVIALKGVVSVALGQYRWRYMMLLYADLSRKMYESYFSRGLLFVRSHHTTTLINNVNAMCHRFASGVVSPLLGILTEVIVVVTLLVLLALYNPYVVLLAVAVFVPVGLVYSLFVRRRMAENGKQENRLQVAQNKTMYEALRGYADIEIAGAKPYVTERFGRGIAQLRHYSQRAMLMRSSSSHLIELALVAGVVAVILLGVGMGQSMASLKIFLGVFAVAAYRIVPSISRIVGGWTEYKRNQYVVDILATEFAVEIEEHAHTSERLTFEQSLELRDVTFGYDPSQPILQHFNLTIGKGEKVGIQGESGKGKTTLFNLLAGLFTPQEGELLVDGRSVATPTDKRMWQNNIAYVSQDLFLPDQSIAENVAFGVAKEQIDHQRLTQALEVAQLGELVRSLPEGVDTITGEAGCRLSGGQRQRLGIARALYKEASVLLFDEATSSLDEQTEREIVASVEALSKSNSQLTILFISHNPQTLSFCDRIVVI